MTGNETRSAFIEYFAGHNHRIVKSSSLVPHDDPTLLFTNAGMVQFKRTFLGEEKRNYARAASSQKCVRAGGKHNDLENVGYTARHHTFFEMLGNFSFGDYFKEEAIELAWNLLVHELGLPEEELWVSVFEDDDEAHALWNQKIGVPVERLVRLGEEDNFWAMGDTGPCGPCSEILIDRGESFGCGRPGCTAGCDCDRYLEIWNLVFMQYNRSASGEMTPLPRPSIDTGMGLERIVAVLQNKATNFGTDLFAPVIGKIEELAQKHLGDSPEHDISMKVIADHSRAAAFLIGDGVLPSNEGRGYVLRRIMRRAIRYGRHLGLTRPFLHETARIVSEIMNPAYPELLEAQAYILNIVLNEEKRFMETLDYGLKILNDTLLEMRAKDETVISGDVIFKLYDTYGFPVDIVQDVVRDQPMTLDMQGFEKAMGRQRAQSRTVVAFSGTGEAYRALTSQGVLPDFVGYHSTSARSEVLLIVKDGEEVPTASRGDTVEVVTAATPFYGEAGGQAGDAGWIRGSGLEVEVADTAKHPTGLIVHRGTVTSGQISKGQVVALDVDAQKRQATACNHTATHLLHTALRRVIGDHVKQAGSLVAFDRLRFDYTHFSPLSVEEIQAIEKTVNEQIRKNIPVETAEMEAGEATKSGAMALFEEKYGDTVRVVALGDFSKELCGGTHTRLTGDIGLFLVLGEMSVAAGMRRIEAITGEQALAHVQNLSRTVASVAQQLKDKPESIPKRVERILLRERQQEKEITALKARMAVAVSKASEDDIRTVRGVSVVAKRVEVDSPAALRDLADRFRDRIDSGVVVLGSTVNNKVLLVTVVTKDLVKRYHAGNIVKKVAAIVGGGGGGRPDMAQAGGNDPSKLSEALGEVYSIIEATPG
ncbi:alanine--tRNA ligase [Thermodesulfobacteriota bacterium]